MGKKERFLKGQITMSTMGQIIIVILLFAAMFPSVVQPQIDAYVATLDTSTSMGALQAGSAQLLPFIVLLGIMMTIINQATPRREGYGY